MFFSRARLLLHLGNENGFGVLARLFMESPSIQQQALLEEFEWGRYGDMGLHRNTWGEKLAWIIYKPSSLTSLLRDEQFCLEWRLLIFLPRESFDRNIKKQM